MNAELATDFTPFMKGLTGQAVLVDSTGRMPVHVNILEATPGTENMFRKGRKVDFKGTFRKTCTLTRPKFDFVLCTGYSVSSSNWFV